MLINTRVWTNDFFALMPKITTACTRRFTPDDWPCLFFSRLYQQISSDVAFLFTDVSSSTVQKHWCARKKHANRIYCIIRCDILQPSWFLRIKSVDSLINQLCLVGLLFARRSLLFKLTHSAIQDGRWMTEYFSQWFVMRALTTAYA